MSDDDKPASAENARPVGIERFMVSVKIPARMMARPTETAKPLSPSYAPWSETDDVETRQRDEALAKATPEQLKEGARRARELLERSRKK